MMDVAAWLRDLGLERYESLFRDHKIDWDVLPKLTSEDLKEIGVLPIGHRRNAGAQKRQRIVVKQTLFVVHKAIVDQLCHGPRSTR